MWIAPINQVMSKRRDKVEQRGAARHQDKATVPSASNSARVIASGRGDEGRCTRTLSSPTLPMIRNEPSRSAAMPGSGVLREPLPVGVARARLEAELLGATQHLGDADGGCPDPMTDLLRLSPDAMKAQQHHKGGRAPDRSLSGRSQGVRLQVRPKLE